MQVTNKRRVVVTGIGMTTPLGTSTEASWDGMINGRSGIRVMEEWKRAAPGGLPLPVTIAGMVPDFEPSRWVDHPRDLRRVDRFILLATAAARQAWQSSGLPERLDGEEANRAGCIIGVGLGGLGGILDGHSLMLEKGPRRVSPFFIPSIISNLAPGHLAIRFNLRGANWAPASACTSGAHGIGEAFMHILTDRADVMLCGGAEACCEPLAVAGFANMQAICKDMNDHPAEASRPFDRNRSGFVLGEGAGMLVLEELEHARRRSAPIFAELVGYGSTSDAHHITAPPEDGEGAQRAFREALRQAQIAPDRVDYINAHGTSTEVNDRAETRAIKSVFGPHAKHLAISSTKSMTGHLLGGAGGVEAVATVLTLHHQVIPPTINHVTPDPDCDLDYVPNTARSARISIAQSNSFGFGGTNGVLLFARTP